MTDFKQRVVIILDLDLLGPVIPFDIFYVFNETLLNILCL